MQQMFDICASRNNLKQLMDQDSSMLCTHFKMGLYTVTNAGWKLEQKDARKLLRNIRPIWNNRAWHHTADAGKIIVHMTQFIG